MSAAERPLRIGLFAPLPPAPSGIADYVADLLPLLPEAWRLTAYVAEPDAVDVARLPADLRLRPLPAAPDAAELDEQDLCLYQIGNGAAHVPNLPFVLGRPGLLVLHDLIVHPARVHAAVGAGDLDGYRDTARAARPDVGARLGDLVATGLWGPSTYWTFPLCEDLVRASRLTAVHGELLGRWLGAITPGAAITSVEHWRAVPEVDEARVARWRSELGAGAATPLIGSFGHVGPAHGIGPLLAAASELAPQHDFRIAIVGSVDPGLDLERRIDAAGLAERVTATGRVSAADFAALMRAADLSVNLRWPTARASSGTLQQLLQLGVPAIVHDLVHLRDLPDAVVLRVPPGPREREHIALVEGLDRWLSDSAARAASRRAAASWAAGRITPARMAASYVEAVERALRQPRAA